MKLSTKLFAYNKENNLFLAEASNLGVAAPERIVALVSERTGAVRHFFMHAVDRDSEGDIAAWVYESPTGMKVKILND